MFTIYLFIYFIYLFVSLSLVCVCVLYCILITYFIYLAVGHRAFNLSGESIYKHSMSDDVPYLAIEHATMGVGSKQHYHSIQPRQLHPYWEEKEDGALGDEFDYLMEDDDTNKKKKKEKEDNNGDTDDDEDNDDVEHRRDEYGYRRFALLLNGENFSRNVNAHSVLLVNFHAPWCNHCARLAPHFERAAQLVQKALARTMNSRLSAAFASVDCTAEENLELCKDEKVMAFPTIRVYRGTMSDALSLNKSKTSSSSSSSSEITTNANDIRHFEVYHGQRSAENLAEFALSLLRTLREADSRVDDDENKPLMTEKPHRLGYDFDRDGKHESSVRSSGCTVEGRLRLAKVPGSIYFSARSHGQTIDLDQINSTHIIKHFSFGDYVPSTSKKRTYVPKKFRKAWTFAAKDGGGKFASNDRYENDENVFSSKQKNTIHEHHMQVVTRSYVPIQKQNRAKKINDDGSASLTVHEYTFVSNKFKIASMSAKHESYYFDNAEDHDFSGKGATHAIAKRGAYVKFAYSLSPIAISHVESAQEWQEWLLNSVTILGGVVAFTYAFESVLHNSLRRVKKFYRKRNVLKHT